MLRPAGKVSEWPVSFRKCTGVGMSQEVSTVSTQDGGEAGPGRSGPAALPEMSSAELSNFISDNDSLYVMPLRIMPFKTAKLRRGRLIRNAMFKPAIEIYRSADGASGQILIEDVTPEFAAKNFGWPTNEIHPDYELLHKLARLTSYDIYSLRILFREHDIPVESEEYLQLSGDMKAKLNRYMRAFTAALIRQVYGEDIAGNLEANEIIDLFRDPDGGETLRNLQIMAKSLELEVSDIPVFLENFADVYLAISYYQNYLDDIVPKMVDMVTDIEDLSKNWQMKQDAHLMSACTGLITVLGDITSSTTGRFETFHKLTDNMWGKLTADSFKKTEQIINGYRTSIAGVLCGLGIKINAWKERFPMRDAGSPQARAEFLISSIRPGMEAIKKIDRSMPLVPDNIGA